MVGILFIKCLRKLSFANIHGYIEGVAGNEAHYPLNDLRIILINPFLPGSHSFLCLPVKIFVFIIAGFMDRNRLIPTGNSKRITTEQHFHVHSQGTLL